MIDEIQEAGVGPVEVLEQESDDPRRAEPLEERAPCPKQLVAATRRRVAGAEQGEHRRFDPDPLRLVGHVLRQHLGDLGPGRLRVVGLEQAGARSNHLAERPERDAFPVGRRATVVPPDAFDDAVDVLEELPGETALADAGLAGDRNQPGAIFASRGMEQVLEQAQLGIAPNERRLQAVRPAEALALADHSQGDPGRDRRLLALEDLVAGRLERDRPGSGPLGRLADENGSRRSGRLESRGRVDEIAGDHALVTGAQVDRGLARQDTRPGLDARTERADRIDKLESGPDASLGIVLVGDRGAPDRHDGIADELLHRAAVPLDDVTGELEVAGQELPDGLRIATLGQRREPDEIREQHRHQPPFGDGA